MVETWHAMSVRHLNERIAAVRAQRDAGKTISEAAEALDVHVGSIRGFIRTHRCAFKFKRQLRPADAPRLAYRRAVSKRGLTLAEAAEFLDISFYSLRVYSLRHNIEWKPEGSWVLSTA